ncbi:MAG: hypothetical protein IJ719_01300 [Clostridia bacterium]|nr:hypothetical protein [Clostridia bacterium]
MMVSAQAKLEKDIWELEYTEHGAPTEFIPMAGFWKNWNGYRTLRVLNKKETTLAAQKQEAR